MRYAVQMSAPLWVFYDDTTGTIEVEPVNAYNLQVCVAQGDVYKVTDGKVTGSGRGDFPDDVVQRVLTDLSEADGRWPQRIEIKP